MCFGSISSAPSFVGGSFFMWIVVVPASHMLTEDESERTRIGGRIAKQFAKVVNPSSPTPSVCLRMM
ncbi:MAG TPA: hypothetical protein VND41_03150 [Nitrososphaerales archaeon]|nr:hypothetical protein [Nitrososphaerales archaeon]